MKDYSGNIHEKDVLGICTEEYSRILLLPHFQFQYYD